MKGCRRSSQSQAKVQWLKTDETKYILLFSAWSCKLEICPNISNQIKDESNLNCSQLLTLWHSCKSFNFKCSFVLKIFFIWIFLALCATFLYTQTKGSEFSQNERSFQRSLKFLKVGLNFLQKEDGSILSSRSKSLSSTYN